MMRSQRVLCALLLSVTPLPAQEPGTVVSWISLDDQTARRMLLPDSLPTGWAWLSAFPFDSLLANDTRFMANHTETPTVAGQTLTVETRALWRKTATGHGRRVPDGIRQQRSCIANLARPPAGQKTGGAKVRTQRSTLFLVVTRASPKGLGGSGKANR